MKNVDKLIDEMKKIEKTKLEDELKYLAKSFEVFVDEYQETINGNPMKELEVAFHIQGARMFLEYLMNQKNN